MSSAAVALLVVLLTLAAVLLASGVAKLRDPQATRDAFDALRVPGVVPADAAARALPWAEISLGVLLLAAPAGWLVPVTVALLLLMLTYTWVIARALGFDEPVSCSCFGRLGRHDVDRTTLARNGLLVLLAAVATWLAVSGRSATDAAGDLDAGGWWALLATAAAVAVAILVSAGPSASGRPGSDVELLDYERRPVPYGVLTLTDGRSATLAELAATQARLLVVLNPGCAPCDRTARRLDDWAGRLAPAVGILALYPTDQSAAGVQEHAPGLSVVEPDLNVRRLFDVGTPAAVLLGADGMLAGGPVAGETAIAEFVEDVLAEVAGEPTPSE